MPIETLALFAGIELITSNVLEPWLYGAHTGLSPVAIMLATIFWTWLWGGVGLLLATPLTVCVAVLGKYIPSLSFLDALLGDEPTLYRQRTLLPAPPRHGPARGRRSSPRSTARTTRWRNCIPTLFVPALAAAEREDQSGTLDARHQRFIFDTTREMVDDMGSAAARQRRNGPANADEGRSRSERRRWRSRGGRPPCRRFPSIPCSACRRRTRRTKSSP